MKKESNFKNIVLIVVYCFIFPLTAFSAINNNSDIALFKQANNYLENNEIEKAIETYQSLLESKERSAQLYGNLGEAYFRNNQLGQSILNIEKALLLAPNNAILRSHLEKTKKSIVQPKVVLQDFFLVRWFNDLIKSFLPQGWFLIHVIFALLSLYTFTIFLFSKHKFSIFKSLSSHIILSIGLVFFILSLMAFFLKHERTHQLKNSGYAIVLEATQLYASADKRSEEITRVPEGSKTKLLEILKDFTKVELRDKDVGWIENETLGHINIQ